MMLRYHDSRCAGEFLPGKNDFSWTVYQISKSTCELHFDDSARLTQNGGDAHSR